jgi:hypothetical protein
MPGVSVNWKGFGRNKVQSIYRYDNLFIHAHITVLEPALLLPNECKPDLSNSPVPLNFSKILRLHFHFQPIAAPRYVRYDRFRIPFIKAGLRLAMYCMGPLIGLIVLKILFQTHFGPMLYLRFPVRNTRRCGPQIYFCIGRREVWNRPWQYRIIAVGKTNLRKEHQDFDVI